MHPASQILKGPDKINACTHAHLWLSPAGCLKTIANKLVIVEGDPEQGLRDREQQLWSKAFQTYGASSVEEILAYGYLQERWKNEG